MSEALGEVASSSLDVAADVEASVVVAGELDELAGATDVGDGVVTPGDGALPVEMGDSDSAVSTTGTELDVGGVAGSESSVPHAQTKSPNKPKVACSRREER